MQCQCSFARVVSAQTTKVRLIYELSALERFQSTKENKPLYMLFSFNIWFCFTSKFSVSQS